MTGFDKHVDISEFGARIDEQIECSVRELRLIRLCVRRFWWPERRECHCRDLVWLSLLNLRIWLLVDCYYHLTVSQHLNWLCPDCRLYLRLSELGL